jgi:hypothetical protein
VSNVRECSQKAPAVLRAVLLHRPDAHPIWHTYLVYIVHLRPLDGLPEPVLAFPDATHEIAIYALDPSCEPDPANPKTLRHLLPVNLSHQLRRRSDVGALAVFAEFVQALSSGALSPDTDCRRAQIGWLERWEQAS